MHFVLLSFLTITFLLRYNQATEIRMSENDMLIKANITHEESNNTWYLAETVYFKPLFHGVIKIIKGDIEMQVFYNLNSSRRMVFHDDRAMEMKSIHNFTWDGVQLSLQTLKTINKLLIFGPTFCYSILKDYNFDAYEGEKSLKFRSNNDGQSLFWVFKFTASITPWVVLSELGSIKVSNYITTDVVIMQIVKFTYLKSMKIETANQFHVGFNEILIDHTDHSKVDTQFDVTKMRAVSWMKFKRQTTEYETVNDLRSGLSYSSNHFGCAIEPSSQNDQFTFGRLTFSEVFLTNWTFQYTNEVLFPIRYQHRDKIITDKMEFDQQIGNISYDLVITSLRVARRAENISSELLLQSLQIERKLYNKENIFPLEYQLAKTQKHFVSSYIKLNHEPEHQVYTLNNKCFQGEKKSVLTLLMKLARKLSPIESYSLLNALDELGEKLKELISLKLGISYLRIKSVRFEFTNIYLIASVEMIERFNFVGSLRKSYRKLDLSGFVPDFSSDNETCLKTEAMKNNVSKIISCNGLKHVCIGITLHQSLPEEHENGSNCVIYNNLDKVLSKLVQEPTLKELQISYKYLNQATLFADKLKFELFVMDFPHDFSGEIMCETHCSDCIFWILIVITVGTVIGLVVILCKLYRQTNNFRVNSSQSISLRILKDL